MSRISQSSEDLILLDSIEDFVEHSRRAIEQARRKIAVVSDTLDPLVYDTDAVSGALSDFARRSRNADLRILVRDTQDMIDRGHRLLRLHQKLPSKALIRKIGVEPNNAKMGFLCVDTQIVVYKNDDRVHQGFANYRGAQEVKSMRDEFERIWEFGVEDPGLRVLHL